MTNLRLHKLVKFRPKVEIYAETPSFILKTVTDTEELIEALKLRYQIFHREMKADENAKPHGIDTDEYDFLCDHLIIKERYSNKIIGTYRLNCTLFSNKFYSQREFHVENILNPEGVKLELGRACIQKEYRRGAVIALLWRGIGEYMSRTNADVLFGCASVVIQKPRDAALLYKYFEGQNRFSPEYFCPPTKKYTMPVLDLWIRQFNQPLTQAQIAEAEELIPALCRAYLRAGAFLGGEPAWDEEFQCIDFLTILPKNNLNSTLGRKYNICQQNQVMTY